MKKFVLKHKWALIAGVIGGAGGFLYWRFIGCNSGTCPIRSVWYWSTLWGAAMGYLVGDMVNDWFVKRKLRKNSQPDISESDAAS